MRGKSDTNRVTYFLSKQWGLHVIGVMISKIESFYSNLSEEKD